eukprot:s236_g12.t1
MATDGPASAAGSGAYPSAVPWNQIPKFVPGETDVRTYARKLEFLQQLWPKDQLEHLGPRAALAVEGVAVQKVSRLDPAKLREPDGVAYLVKALGGQWGRLDSEEKYDLFERALFQVSQRQDETNDSYLARHDAAFEDLLGRKVGLEEIRAYILLRQSVLSPDDRKRVIMENDGQLTYEGARKHIRLLGSKFFQDLQGGSGGRPTKLKTYDVNYTEEEPTYFHEEEDLDEEAIMAAMIDDGDEDAESSELASCFTAYQEARFRLKEKAKVRGFWPLSGQKGRGKTKSSYGKSKGNSMGKGSMGGGQNVLNRRRSLADRIANSTCRRCGRPGHWKRECPLQHGAVTDANKKNQEIEAFTGIMLADDQVQDEDPLIVGDMQPVISDLPANAQQYVVEGGSEIFNVVEEADDEAIIDTGASRAVIGSHRLERLVRSFPPEIRSKVMRVPTDGIVFKFGNAGRLSSEFAVLLPRAQKDWFRVEVNTCPKDLSHIIGAMEPNQTYLKKMLSSPVDTTLHSVAVHQNAPQDLAHPPDVNTLEEWGMKLAPSGKHPQKTYAEIYENDLKYVNQMWNRRAVAPWVRSFQLYCRHRREASIEHQRLETKRQGLQMPVTPHMTPEVADLVRAGGAPWLSPRTNAKLIEQKKIRDKMEKEKLSAEKEWEHVEKEEKPMKRSLPATSSSMEIQPNEGKVAQLQAQIAALQRDLQVELQGSAWQTEDA